MYLTDLDCMPQVRQSQLEVGHGASSFPEHHHHAGSHSKRLPGSCDSEHDDPNDGIDSHAGSIGRIRQSHDFMKGHFHLDLNHTITCMALMTIGNSIHGIVLFHACIHPCQA